MGVTRLPIAGGARLDAVARPRPPGKPWRGRSLAEGGEQGWPWSNQWVVFGTWLRALDGGRSGTWWGGHVEGFVPRVLLRGFRVGEAVG